MAILRKYRQRSENPESELVRRYLTSAKRDGHLTDPDEATVRRVLDQFDTKVQSELARLKRTLPSTLAALRSNTPIEIFALDDEMLQCAIEIGASDLELQPYDQAVLAAVVVRASQLRGSGATDVLFCERDGDLQPWDKRGNAKQPLTGLYDEAGVWVYGDFEIAEPPPVWWLARFGSALT